MNLFFDTNVLLDVALRREPFYQKSEEILRDSLCAHACFLSWHTISNLFYIITRQRTEQDGLEFICFLEKTFTVAPVKNEDLGIALAYYESDFEDAMQIACAVAIDADLIITRDQTGFSLSPIQVVSP